jgi:hypothetical protein
MIDNFSLALSHGLLLLAAWRLLSRPDLDDDGSSAPEPPAKGGSRWSTSRKPEDAQGA